MQPFNGLVYFRIRQIDLSGQYGFSAVRHVEFFKGEIFKFWPNPAVMQIQVEATQAGELQILNQFGRLHIQSKILPGYAQFINIGHLPKGVYILRFQDLSGNATVSRLMKN
jgi:Secretion system C-terminal sorting domain